MSAVARLLLLQQLAGHHQPLDLVGALVWRGTDDDLRFVLRRR
jgi:hypothetical protein